MFLLEGIQNWKAKARIAVSHDILKLLERANELAAFVNEFLGIVKRADLLMRAKKKEEIVSFLFAREALQGA